MNFFFWAGSVCGDRVPPRAGRTRDEALGELRRAGAWPIECIKAIRAVEGVSSECPT